MKDTLRAHFVHPPGDKAFRFLEDQLSDGMDISTGMDIPSNCDYLIAGRPTAGQLQSIDVLKALIIPWAGLPPVTRTLMQQHSDIPVHNIHHNARIVAEHAITLMLAVAKRIIPNDRTFRNDDWSMRYDTSDSLLIHGKTALILGYGALGQQIGRYCTGLGMQVLGVRRTTAAGEESSRIYPVSQLTSLLPKGDVLFVCVPHTDDTDGMITSEEIERLPGHAIIVNVARGSVIDEESLFKALKNNKIHGAGLDVWYRYPDSQDNRKYTPPSRFPFSSLDNVVMSPHRAGLIDPAVTETYRMQELAMLLNAAATGSPIPNRVDIERGY